MPTIKNTLTKYPSQLSKISSTPKLDVEVLLSYAIKKPKEFLYTYPEHKLNKKQLKKFNNSIIRRLKNEPIVYIIGEKEFYGLNFIVNKNALIPRPETELLVNEAIKEIISIRRSPLMGDCGGAESPLRHSLSAKDRGEITQKLPPFPKGGLEGFQTYNSNTHEPTLKKYYEAEKTILIDIGTGSGCIPISIIKNLQKDTREKIQIYAIDISSKALTVAKKNARLHGEKEIKFIKNDLLKLSPLLTLPPAPSAGGGVNIIITANLPYISNPEYKKLPPDIKKYEPKNALIAGKDGLKYYYRLFKQIAQINSRKITLLIEIDFKTMCSKSKLEKTIKQYLPNSRIEIKKDFGGAERVAVIKKID